ncbi:NAD-glutamate dehydrogenase [Millisia brevis]|uniref:NAD-glutamate dehydrogenase n=1 Tax=Millisia brevis TaxID=264148 RepID=UPI0008343AB7|nr:NAD-glutamate dehydrogenase [Millisia brevis]
MASVRDTASRSTGVLVPDADVEKLVRRAFARAEESLGHGDITGISLDEAAASHCAMARVRKAGESLVAVTPGDDDAVGSIRIVTADAPALVESVLAALRRVGVNVEEVVHPVVRVERDGHGVLRSVAVPGESPAEEISDGPATRNVVDQAESWLLLLPTEPIDAERVEPIRDAALVAIGEVEAEVRDRVPMAETLRAVSNEVSARGVHQDVADFLRWLSEDRYRILGYRRYTYEPAADGAATMVPVADSGLGVLGAGIGEDRAFDVPNSPVPLPERTLLVSKSATRVSVQRSQYPDVIVVRTFDDAGATTGEHRFVGVLGTGARHEFVLDIPLLGDRVRRVIAESGHETSAYSGQVLLESIQALPRSELMAMSPKMLTDAVSVVTGVHAGSVPTFLRSDIYGRFVSAVVYLPRERFSTEVVRDIERVLRDELGGDQSYFTIRVSDQNRALVHFVVRYAPPKTKAALSPEDAQRIREAVTRATRTWDDGLHALAHDTGAHPQATEAVAHAFPTAYKADFTPVRALADAARLRALEPGDIDLQVHRPDDAATGAWRLTLYVRDEEVSLSRVLPVLSSLGVEVLDERPYHVPASDKHPTYRIYDFGVHVGRDLLATAIDPDLDTDIGLPAGESLRRRFGEAFTALWSGRAEVDRFNELVLRAGLDWRQAAVLRAYAKYLRQAGFAYSQYNIEGVLLAQPDIARMLVDLFVALFDPREQSTRRAGELRTRLRERIDAVVSLDVDRILRALFGLIDATLRTNVYRTDIDGEREVISFKFDPHRINELPRPKPRFEIFVYGPRVEGVHLRFGAVARGGLRWSDRLEDFRTEVLGLAKAQEVKNAVIVPVGAKGGFVVKQPPIATGDAAADRAAQLEEARRSYRWFIRGLLDVTDNIDVDGTILPPPGVVRRDADDSYLVVAADKGTATFSDLANSVADEYGFWLGDAFASGGSHGYDHKAMGITARGAWKSVERHFRELGHDTRSEDFTVAGIGDMSGDVFGNGMLLSPHIRLVAAFDHRHIFIDPNPDATAGFIERRRMFRLPRSSWADYDRSLISAGGGVWERSAKSVPISPQIREALGIEPGVDRLAPPELIKYILRAPVDLLWNGGIGTYIKAADETHADVGDKSNDAVRIDGREVRARVIGEGGNLGVTRRGRIEFAKIGGPKGNGGHINTDAIDNSAGVDSSDHEVNIKILLNGAVTDGSLPAGERNDLLASMTDEVGELVLAHNFAQNEQLGATRAESAALTGVFGRVLDDLVERAGLDRELEVLPDDAQIAERVVAGPPLTSPELSTLGAHIKLALNHELLESDLPDNDVFADRALAYFPAPLRERFADQIRQHTLRRQIVANRLTNETIDNGGMTFPFRLREDAGASGTDAVRAYVVTTSVFGLDELWAAIRGTAMPAAAADRLILESHRLLDRAARWFLAGGRPQPLAVGAEINRYRDRVRRLESHVVRDLSGPIVDDIDRRASQAIALGAPDALARTVATKLDMFTLLDVIDVADIAGVSDAEAANVYFALNRMFDFDRMLTRITDLPRGDRWQTLARLALRDDLYGAWRTLTLNVLEGREPGDTPQQMIDEWLTTNSVKLDRARAAWKIGEDLPDLAMLSVAMRNIRRVVRGSGSSAEGA